MNETIWQPSLLHPGRIHARHTTGRAHCGAELDPAPVRCALCTLATTGIQPHADTDVRSQIATDCADCAEPHPELLFALRDGDLDTDPETQYRITHTVLTVEHAIAAAYADAERILSTLDAAPKSTRAHGAREHLMETLVALNESLTSHDHVIRALRQPSGTVST